MNHRASIISLEKLSHKRGAGGSNNTVKGQGQGAISRCRWVDHRSSIISLKHVGHGEKKGIHRVKWGAVPKKCARLYLSNGICSSATTIALYHIMAQNHLQQPGLPAYCCVHMTA